MPVLACLAMRAFRPQMDTSSAPMASTGAVDQILFSDSTREFPHPTHGRCCVRCPVSRKERKQLPLALDERCPLPRSDHYRVAVWLQAAAWLGPGAASYARSNDGIGHLRPH